MKTACDRCGRGDFAISPSWGGTGEGGRSGKVLFVPSLLNAALAKVGDFGPSWLPGEFRGERGGPPAELGGRIGSGFEAESAR